MSLMCVYTDRLRMKSTRAIPRVISAPSCPRMMWLCTEQAITIHLISVLTGLDRHTPMASAQGSGGLYTPVSPSGLPQGRSGVHGIIPGGGRSDGAGITAEGTTM